MQKIFITISFLFLLAFGQNANAQKCKAVFNYYIYDTTNEYHFQAYRPDFRKSSFYWDLGDGNTSTSSILNHTYKSNGTYKVCVFTDSAGCKDTACQTIVANKKNPCNADFTALQDKSNPLKWNFSAIDTLEDVYIWDPFPGSSKTTRFNYTFSTKGTYSIKLVVSNAKDHCRDTVIKKINVVKKCQVTLNYWIHDTINNYYFEALRSNWNLYSYKWDLGDGNTSTRQGDLHHTYKSNGTYNVCVYTDSSGCKDTACVTIVANKKNPCNANFTAVQDKSNPLIWHFAAIDTLEEYYNWGWSYGPKKYTHTFSSAGTYSMYLIVGNKKEHCIDTVVKSINVQQCGASFKYTIDSTNNYKLKFTNTSYASSTAKYFWSTDLGGYTSKDLSLTYSKTGYTIVCLDVIDTAIKCKDSVCKKIYIGNPPCDSSFAYRVSNDSLYFAYTGGGTKTKWDYGDGTIDSGYTHGGYVYSKPGNYTVCLTTYCASTKRTSKYCVNITIKSKGCNADFSITQDSKNTLKYHFLSPNYPQSNRRHDWYINWSKQSSSRDSFSSVFSTKGHYNVCHIYRDTVLKCSDTVCKTVSIGQCDSSFSHFVRNDSLFFSYTGNGAKSLKWDFGNGYSYKGSVTHGEYQYAKAGTYTVCLTAYCSSSDSSKKCVTITIKPKNCNADFTYKRDSFNTYKYYFTSLSAKSSTMKYDWNWGDGDTSARANPSKTYNKSATALVYNVCLRISDTASNCFDTMCRDVIVYPPICDSAFSYTIKSDSLYFSYTYNAKTVKYNFGDGKTSTNKTGYHIYSKPGNYKVCLTAYCSSTDSSEYCVNITIKSKCQALFSVALDTTQKFKLYLINKSSNTGSTLYAWDFGDGNYSGKRNPTHKYSKFGKYNVCLLVYDTTINCYSKYCDTLGLDSSGKLLKADAWELVVLEQTVFGVKRIVKSDFKIYPNPANTKVTIDLSNAINTYQKLEILNSNGQVCIAQSIEAGNDIIDIDLEKIARGLYLIKLGNGHGYSYMKLIKN